MAPKIQTPSDKLKKIKMVEQVKDIKKWTKKVSALIALGADPKVLDNYDDNNSIITEYVIADQLDTDELYNLIKYLLNVGVTPTNEVFVSCLMHSVRHADLIMEATGNTINVNTLDIYGTPVHMWVAKEIIKNKVNRPISQIQYLTVKGLKTDVKKFSINDLEEMMKKIHLP